MWMQFLYSLFFFNTGALQPLGNTQPRKELLQVRYLQHQRWVWKMLSSQSCDALFHLLMLTRLDEGFTLVPTSNTYIFYKEFYVTGAASGGQRVLSSMQCAMFYSTPTSLVVEVWVEPQLGYVTVLLFPCHNFYSNVSSSICNISITL